MTTSSDLRRPPTVRTAGPAFRLTRRAALAGAALAGVALAAAPARAQSLDEARARGLVGEQPNGYLGVVTPAPGIEALVTSINAQRRAAYEGIARDNGVPLAAVEQQAGQTLIGRAAPGTFVMNASGTWVRK